MPKTTLYIARDRRLPDGRTLYNERISRPLQRVSVARRVLKRFRRRNPAAFAIQSAVFD
jgi:hypothetical protein